MVETCWNSAETHFFGEILIGTLCLLPLLPCLVSSQATKWQDNYEGANEFLNAHEHEEIGTTKHDRPKWAGAQPQRGPRGCHGYHHPGATPPWKGWTQIWSRIYDNTSWNNFQISWHRKKKPFKRSKILWFKWQLTCEFQPEGLQGMRRIPLMTDLLGQHHIISHLKCLGLKQKHLNIIFCWTICFITFVHVC